MAQLPINAGDKIWSLGGEDPLEKDMATHSSILAWRIPWMEEPGQLQSMGSQRIGYHLVTKQRQQRVCEYKQWKWQMTENTLHQDCDWSLFFLPHLAKHKQRLSYFFTDWSFMKGLLVLTSWAVRNPPISLWSSLIIVGVHQQVHLRDNSVVLEQAFIKRIIHRYWTCAVQTLVALGSTVWAFLS